MSSETRRPYSLNEEIAHGVTHGLGAVFSIVGLVVMAVYAAQSPLVSHMVAVSVYGGSLILLYLASTLYHSIPIPKAKPFLHMLDHAAIYVLIAGTYTPFALIGLAGPQGWWLFGIVWALAVVGVIFKLFYTGRFEKLSVGLYLAMGWLILAFGEAAMAALSSQVLMLLLAGGLAYSAGVVFYLWHGLRFNHTIWHLFVMLGSLLQFLAVLELLVPAAA